MNKYYTKTTGTGSRLANLRAAVLCLLMLPALSWAQTLKTPWADKVDKNCPRPEYPRPIMQRAQWLCLNGQWDYAILDTRRFGESSSILPKTSPVLGWQNVPYEKCSGMTF